jgi:thiamine-monophosphate kinase
MPLREKELIAGLRRMAASKPRRGIATGIGDDCAVLQIPSGHEALITTDFSLEGVHFRCDWHPPESIGHRCLARGLSDIAAMGGEPIAFFLSLALPRALPQFWVNRFMRGMLKLAEKHRATLAGGDTAESPGGILADIVVVGSVPKGKAILRSGARPGDGIYISGQLGGSAAAVQRMQAGPDRKLSGKKLPGKKLETRLYPDHFYPEPRIKLGKILREKRLATAMIDTSDGLSTDLAHICEESGVGAELEATLIPRSSVGNPSRAVELELALHGGEDYELLFTAPKGKRIPAQIAGTPITQIGRITDQKAIYLKVENGLRPLKARGWEHFRN